MNPTATTACSAALGLLASGIVVSFPGVAPASPARTVGVFWLFALLAWPLALYGAFILVDFVTDPSPGVDHTRMVVNAHLVGLALAGLALTLLLLLNLMLSGLDLQSTLDLLPRAATAAVAGGTGLALGALPAMGKRKVP